MAAGVVLASGSGTRVGADLNKVYLPLAGRRVLAWSLDALASVSEIGVLVLVIRPEDGELAADVVRREVVNAEGLPIEVVFGGATRQDSELCALRQLADRIDRGEIDAVLIHDAARPLVSSDLVAAVLRVARDRGGAIPCLPRRDLVAVREDGAVITDAALGSVVAVQTPQGFQAGPLLAAYEQAAKVGFVGTDTAACMARFSSVDVGCIPGDERNFKITYAQDLIVAAKLLESAQPGA